MTKVLASITTSVDGYITGPNDGPGKGLGEGGERLHYWVFGGPWTYDAEPRGEATGEDAAWLAETMSRIGAVVGGRGTYEAAGHWGDENPWGLPFFIVTHRPEEQPEGGAFTFVAGVEEAVERAGKRRATRTSASWAAPTSSARRSRPGSSTSSRSSSRRSSSGAGSGCSTGSPSRSSSSTSACGSRPYATFIDYRVKRP